MCAYDTSQNNVIDTQIINQYSVATVEMYTVFFSCMYTSNQLIAN